MRRQQQWLHEYGQKTRKGCTCGRSEVTAVEFSGSTELFSLSALLVLLLTAGCGGSCASALLAVACHAVCAPRNFQGVTRMFQES